MLHSSITMQKESAWHASMPDRFFIALNIACETRIFLFNYPQALKHPFAADLPIESAKMFLQLYKSHSKAHPQAGTSSLLPLGVSGAFWGKP